MIITTHKTSSDRTMESTKGNSYRLRFPRRVSRLTRIGIGPGAAKTAGLPVDVRGGILRTLKEGSPPMAASMPESRAQARPQPSSQPRLSNLPENMEMPSVWNLIRRSDLGREGRLRVGPWPKLSRIRRHRRELILLIRLQNAEWNIARPANDFHSAKAVSYSSQVTKAARGPSSKIFSFRINGRAEIAYVG
jgi:hypothetical protein